MKITPQPSSTRKGFTLPELMVAMTITIVITILTLSITGTAIDAWRGARTEIRAAGQAKVMLNALGRDLESMVSRQGNNIEQWLVVTSQDQSVGPQSQPSPNASRLTFFTSAADRYNGNAGSRESINTNSPDRNADMGGDISAVSYQLDFVDPVWGDPNQQFSTFVLYRNLLDPFQTYNNVSGQPDLEQAFIQGAGPNQLDDLMCENIYEFTVIFSVTYRDLQGQIITTKMPVMATAAGLNVKRSFALNGTGIAPDGNTQTEFVGGRISAVEIAITVLSDEGVTMLKRRQFRSIQEKAQFLEQHAFRYTRSVTIPQG